MTEKWPVLHAGGVPHVDLATWTFRVCGEVEQEVELTWDELQRAAAVEQRPGHPLRHALEPLRRGVRGRPLARARRALPTEAERALRDRLAEHDFTANVPIAFLEDERALLATHADGEPLTPDHGYPLRLVDPAQVLLEERQVAAAGSSCAGRPAGLLGALRLPQRRRPLAGGALQLLSEPPRDASPRRVTRAIAAPRRTGTPSPPPRDGPAALRGATTQRSSAAVSDGGAGSARTSATSETAAPAPSGSLLAVSDRQPKGGAHAGKPGFPP